MAPRATGLETRQRLIEAGIDALGSLELVDLVAAVGTRELARRAGVSSATFFHHFENVQVYGDAVLEWLYSVQRSIVPAQVGATVQQLRRASLPVDSTMAFHQSEIMRMTSDPEFRVRIGVWALGGPRADTAYGDYLAAVDDLLVPPVVSLYESWGREIREPYDPASFVALHVAFSQGASMRHLMDPVRMPVSAFQRAASALSLNSVRMIGDRRTVDDRLAELNYFPLRHVPSGDRGALSRARVLDAAAALFGMHGYEQTTVAMLARASGVSEATVYEHFRSKSGVAVALLLTQGSDVLDGVADSVQEAEPSEQVRAVLEEIASFIASRADHAVPYLAALVCGQPTGNDDQLIAAVADVVGSLNPTAPRQAVDQLSRLVLGAVISRVISHPVEPPSAAVAWVLAAVSVRVGPTEGPVEGDAAAGCSVAAADDALLEGLPAELDER